MFIEIVDLGKLI